jgi:hypothetical protein
MRMPFSAVLSVLLCALLAQCGDDDVNDAVFKSLRADQQKCRRDIEGYRGSGLIAKLSTSGGRTDLIVDDRRWDALDSEARKLVGLSAYCIEAGPDGRHKVAITGSRHDEPKGGVTNGNWVAR